MPDSDLEYDRLPSPLKADGEPRRVGIEFEFGGLKLDEVVAIVVSTLAGEPGEKNAAEQSVEVAELGKFNIEVDWDLLKRLSDNDEIPDFLTQALSDSATIAVPVEIVSPPIAAERLEILNALVANLREAGARGTEQSLLYAFGLHINVELPDCDTATLDRYLKAYALLQEWLFAENATDLSRRLTPYIERFPDEYLLQVLQRTEPDMAELFDDYLRHNPTRNRALDMLPLLAHIDEERVRDTVDDNRIKSRPAFHYRLPDCRLDDPDWSLARPWNLWCYVERLAHDKDLLDKVTAAAVQEKQGRARLLEKHWQQSVTEWLPEPA